VTQAGSTATVKQTKVNELGETADRTNQIDKKYSENLKTLEVYSFAQPKFVPDISFILDGSYVGRNLKDATFETLEVPEFIHSGIANQNRGFNLNYGELYLHSAVDPYFDLSATIPFFEDGVEIEEAYITTTSLPLGFQVKAGKFRSSFGRLNPQHEHVWDFADAPLVNRAFFGEEGLDEKGGQINWLAPTPFYLLLGTEILQGENDASFGTSAITLSKNAFPEFTKNETQRPNLLVAFIKSSTDIGNLSVLGGLSFAYGKTRLNDTSQMASYGDTQIYGIDLTAKYFIDSYRYVSWQNEFMYRHMDLTTGADLAPDDPTQPLSIFHEGKRQSGFYSQLVFRFAERWRIGARYDLLNQNDVYVSGVKQNLPEGLNKLSAMIDFHPSEFSMLRLQFSRDSSLFAGNSQYFGIFGNNTRESKNEVILQYNIAIGAHGAHSF